MSKVAAVGRLIDELNQALKAEVKGLLLPDGGAFLCGPDGSVSDEEAERILAKGGAVEVRLDIEHWPESTRTLTEKGRAEIADEEAAEERVLAKARALGFTVLKDGVGSGGFGPITCYSLGHV